MIPDNLIEILKKHAVILGIFCFAGYMPEDRRGIDRFCKSPVHPVMHHRLSIPVCGIDKSRRTVNIPGICYGTAV